MVCDGQKKKKKNFTILKVLDTIEKKKSSKAAEDGFLCFVQVGFGRQFNFLVIDSAA